jgi:predicted outer membrane repeat protein
VATDFTFVANSFVGNSAGGEGGGIYIGTSTEVDFSLNEFLANDASEAGGAIYLNGGSYVSVESNNVFANNVGGEEGGAILCNAMSYTSFGGLKPALIESAHPLVSATEDQYFISENPLVDAYLIVFSPLTSLDLLQIIVDGNIFTGNITYEATFLTEELPGIGEADPLLVQSTSGFTVLYATEVKDKYGLAMTVYPFIQSLGPHASAAEEMESFTNNSAKVGGALKIVESTSVLVRKNNFIHNRALDAGGAINLKEVQNAYIYDSNFTKNSALQGGALSFDSLVSTFLVWQCTFSYNNASERGGAVSALTSNGKGFNGLTSAAVYVKETSMVGNAAGTNGGAITLQNGNAVVLMNSTIVGCIAENGGALHMDTVNHVSLMNVSLTDNMALVNGGAVYISGDNEFISHGLLIHSNRAMNVGGGLFSDSSRVHLDRTSFIENRATHSGGASSFAGSSVVVFEEGATTFVGNTAPYAAAIDFGQSLTSIQIADSTEAIRLQDNACLNGGGVVYFTRDTGKGLPNIFSSAVDNVDRVIYVDNSVITGDILASQSFSLKVNGDVNYTDYTTPLPPITVTMLDFYNNTNTSDSLSFAEVSIANSNCLGKTAFLSGTARVQAIDGVFTFNALTASCYPEGNVTLTVDVSLDGLGTDYALTTSTFVDFRQCSAGEIISENMCVSCGNGTYSLEFVNESTSCEECPSNTETCYSNFVSGVHGLCALITSY